MDALRGHHVVPGRDDKDPVIELIIAMIRRAKRDAELPVRERGVISSRSRLPSAEEKAQAEEFLSMCAESFGAKLS